MSLRRLIDPQDGVSMLRMACLSLFRDDYPYLRPSILILVRNILISRRLSLSWAVDPYFATSILISRWPSLFCDEHPYFTVTTLILRRISLVRVEHRCFATNILVSRWLSLFCDVDRYHAPAMDRMGLPILILGCRSLFRAIDACFRPPHRLAGRGSHRRGLSAVLTEPCPSTACAK